MDEALEQHRPVDLKTEELLRFALSIKARSAPCVRKHYRGSLAAGASEQEIAWVFALTMREAAGPMTAGPVRSSPTWLTSRPAPIAAGAAVNARIGYPARIRRHDRRRAVVGVVS